MVVSSHNQTKRNNFGIILVLLPITILLLSGIQSSFASDPLIVDNGDYTFTATWGFTDMTNFTSNNLTPENGVLNLTKNQYFWNQSSSIDFSGGERSNVIEGDGIVISSDDLSLGHLINQNFTTPYNWVYTNGSASNVVSQWSPLEKGSLSSVRTQNITYQSIIIQPEGNFGIDTYLNENSPGTNYGSGTSILVERGFWAKNSLLWFDLSSLVDTKILDAQLELFMNSSEDAVSTLDISVHRITDSWSEMSTNWNNRDFFNAWSNPGGDYDPVAVDTVWGLTNNFNWKSWNVTTLVDDWVSGVYQNNGVILLGSSGATTWKQFYTSDHSSNRPRLSIQYYELNSYNETSNITQKFPLLDPGAYIDTSIQDFTQGTHSDTQVIPSGGGEVGLNSLGYYTFDTLDDLSDYDEDPTKNKNGGDFYLSTTTFMEGTSSMEMIYTLPTTKHSYGVRRLAITSWDWSRYTDLSIWTKSSGQGEIFFVEMRDSAGVLWACDIIPLISSWENQIIDLGDFPGDISSMVSISFVVSDTTEPTSTFIDNVTLLGGAPYKLQGNFTSRVFDGNYPAIWDSIIWEQNLPAGTNIEIRTRTGNASIPDASWSTWSSIYTQPYGSLITSPQGRYIQYMAYLTTSDSGYSPSIVEVLLVKSEYNMTFKYSIDEYSNIFWGRLFLKLDEMVIWEKIINGTQPSTTITLDIGRYLTIVGDTNVEFGLTVDSNNAWNVNVTVTLDDFQIKGFTGEYTSSIYDASSEVIFGNITWNGDLFPNTSITLQTQTSMDNISWSPWSNPFNASFSNVSSPIARYIRYRVNFTTETLGLTPIFKDINITYTKYSPIGELTFLNDLTVNNVTNWGYLTANWNLFGQIIKLEYSINSGLSFNPIASDLNLSSVSTSSGTIRFRLIMETDNTSFTPTLYSLTLTYSVNRPPEILGIVPNQTQIEDGGTWILDLSSYESDFEDSPEKLKWFITGENVSLYFLEGEYSPDNILRFTPNPNVYGNNLVTLWLEDNFGERDSQDLWINITPVNDAPEIRGVIPSYEKTENDPNWQIDLSGYKYDVDNLPSELSWSIFGWDAALFDSVSISGNILTFDLAPDAYGNDEMTVVLNDAMYAVNQNLWVNVSFVNKAPTINGEIPDFNVLEDDPGWILDLTSYEWDREDPYPSSGLSWGIWGFNSSLYSYSIVDNNITFIPHPDVYGNNEIIITLTDSLGLSTSQNIWINITPQNDAPEIFGVIPDQIKIEDDLDWNYDLSIYKSDIDNSTNDLRFSVSDWDNSLFDSVSIIGDIIYFDLAPNAYGSDDIIISLSDGILSDSQIIFVNVSSENDVPWLSGIIPGYSGFEDDSLWVLDLTSYENDIEDGSPSTDLVWNVLGVDSDLLTVDVNDNNLTFNLRPNAYGDNEITVILSDKEGAMISQKIWVNITSENDAPIINGIIPSFDKVEDAPNWVWDLTSYKSDVDNQTSELTWTITGWDTKLFDSVFIMGDLITFDLVANAFGNDDLQITLSDGLISVSQTIWINVTPQNDAPQIIGIISDFLVTEDVSPWIYDLTNFEYDIEDGGPSIQLAWSVTGLNSNLLSIEISDNNLTFIPKPDAYGNNELTLLLTDSLGFADTQTFWVNISSENDAPVILGFIPDFQKNEDDPNWNLDLSGYKYDVDNTSWELTWTVLNWDILLFDSVNQVGDIIVFDLMQDAYGNNEITLILNDGIESDTQTFWVNVTSINDAPVIQGVIDDIDKFEDDPVWVLDLTSYELDVENIPPSSDLTWTLVNVDTSLLTAIVVDNNITFTLKPNAYGNCEITVILTDGQGLTDSQKLWINVAPLNDAPEITGVIPSYTVDEDALNWSLDLSTYKVDIDNTQGELSWSVSGWDSSLFDSVSIIGNTLSFDLAPNAYGNDQILIILDDGTSVDSQQIWVNVNSINDAPQILGTIPDIQKSEDSSNWILDLTSYESDVEDGAPSPLLTWSVIGVDSSLLSISVVDNVLTFDVVQDAYGYDLIAISLTDSGGLSVFQDVLIEIESVNDDPWIQPSVPNIITDEDVSTSFDLSGYAHDIEDSQAQLRWIITGADSSIYSWHIDTATKILYVDPLPNAWGTDDITITLMDTEGAVASQPLQVVIISVNDAPYISPQIPESLFETLEDNAISLRLNGYENDVEDTDTQLRWEISEVDASVIRVTLSSSDDNLVIVPVISFSPDDTDIIETQINLSLTDSGGLSTWQLITVKIIPVNNEPVLYELPDLKIRFDRPYEFDFTAYCFDEDTELKDLILTTSEPTTDSGNGYITVDGLKVTFFYPDARNGDDIAVLITLSDGQLSDYAIMQISIWDHTPPELTTPIPDVVFDEDTEVNSAFDLDDHFTVYGDGELNYTYYIEYSHHGGEYVLVSIGDNNTVDFHPALDWYGIEYITFRAEDAYGAISEATIMVTVNPINDAPVIVDIPDQECKVNVSKTINLRPYINDVDTPVESLILTTDSSYITASGHNIILNYPDITREIVNIYVLDGFSQGTIQIEVTAEANRPPEISIIPNLVVHGGEVYLFSLIPYVDDPDDDIAELLVWTDSPYITQNGGDNLLLQIDFPASMTGQELDVSLFVSDGQVTNSTVVPIQITDELVPIKVADIPNLFFEEDSVLVDVLDLGDYFQNTQEYETFGNDKINVTIVEGIVSISALANWSGEEMITFRAILGEAFAEDTIEVKVKPVDDAPVIAPLPSYDKKVNEIWTLNLKEYITDIDTPINQISISVDSKYVILHSNSIYFQYQFPIYDMFTITVSDGSNTVYGIVYVNVTVDNKPPTYIGLLSTVRINPGETWDIDLDDYFFDGDGNALTFSCNNEEIIINPITHVASWTPTNDQTILEDVVFYANDGLVTIESSPIDIIVTGKESGPTFQEQTWWIFLILALIIIILVAYVLLRREAEDEEEEYKVPVTKAVDYLSTEGSGNYIIKSPTSDSSYRVFSGLLKKGFEGLCITTKAPEDLTNNYDLGKAWIIKLALRGQAGTEGTDEETKMMGLLALGDEEREEDKYIFSLNFNRIVETIEEFLTTGEKKVVLLDGLEYILGGEELIMYIGFIASLRERMKDRHSCLLIPVDPRTLSEKEMGLLERETMELGKILSEVSKGIYVHPLDRMEKKVEEDIKEESAVAESTDDIDDHK